MRTSSVLREEPLETVIRVTEDVPQSGYMQKRTPVGEYWFQMCIPCSAVISPHVIQSCVLRGEMRVEERRHFSIKLLHDAFNNVQRHDIELVGHAYLLTLQKQPRDED